jgi:hypothetical protein
VYRWRTYNYAYRFSPRPLIEADGSYKGLDATNFTSSFLFLHFIMPQGSDATQTTPLPIPQQSSSVVSNSSTTSSTHRSQPSSGRISHRTSKESVNRKNNTADAPLPPRYKPVPRLLNDSLAQPAPPTLMYWSRAPSHGMQKRRHLCRTLSLISRAATWEERARAYSHPGRRWDNRLAFWWM